MMKSVTLNIGSKEIVKSRILQENQMIICKELQNSQTTIQILKNENDNIQKIMSE